MDIRWRRLLLMMLWSLTAEGVYHLPSIQTVPAPPEASKNSLFGYSIAYQPTTKRLIVSAPNNDVIGKIYDCNIQNKRCAEFNADVLKDYEYDKKMWLGATVATGPNFTLACAPRYLEHKKNNTNITKQPLKGTFGRCFVTSPTNNKLSSMVTMRDEAKGTTLKLYELYMDTFGWSAHVTNHDSVLVGGPAMSTGRVMYYSNIDATPKLLNMYRDGKTTSNIKYNYGYSITSGHFNSANSDDITYAVSSPYGVFGMGLIVLITGNKERALQHPPQFSPQVGAMYGAALATASLSPDGRQALLVGAPAYAIADKIEIDRGAVYIFQYDAIVKGLKHRKTILGNVDNGRFGSAIVSLGDLNGDGLDEIAVAAPYEDSGAVYIYSGSQLLFKSVDQPQWLQRIKPSGFQTFGLSLVTLQDYDGNGCNELAVGAPESNSVAVLSCIATFTLVVTNLQPLKTATFPSSRRNDTYFVYNSCVHIKYPEKPATVSAEIQVTISITHLTAKLVNAKNDGSFTYSINIKDKTQSRPCHEVGILIPEVVGYEPLIQYQIKAVQLNSPEDVTVFNPSRLLLSDLSHLENMYEIWVADCEGDKECIPVFNFTIHTTIKNNYIIGSSRSENVSVVASNSGDVAYSACMRVRTAGAHVLRPPPSCETAQDDSDVLWCQPRSPVKNHADWQSDPIELDMSSLNSKSSEITFEVVMYPNCNDKDQKGKEPKPEKLTVTLKPDPTEFVVKGSTNIGNIVEVTSEELEQSGKSFSHDYTIFNSGVTDWTDILCEITIEKKPYVKAVNVDLNIEPPAQCTIDESRDDSYTVTCNVDELKKTAKLGIVIALYMTPGTIKAKQLKSKNVTVSSHVRLTYGDHNTVAGVTSTMKLKVGQVALWIILLAVLVGLLIVCIIIYVLYKRGYLKRKNKDNLKRLRRSVYRQSVRRSQLANSRSSNRQSGDKQTEALLDDDSGDGAKVPVDIFEAKNKPGAANGNDAMKEVTKKKVLKNLPEDEECQVKKKEQIIRGLQKNLDVHRSNKFLAPPLKEKSTEHDF